MDEIIKENETMQESCVVGTNEVRDFDKVKIFESLILPKFIEMKHLCLFNGLPFFAAFCVADKDGKSFYKFEGVSPETINVRVSDDFFNKIVMVVNGCNAVPPTETVDDEIVSRRAQTMLDFSGRRDSDENGD